LQHLTGTGYMLITSMLLLCKELSFSYNYL